MAARAERTGGLANTARPQFGGFPPLGSRNSDEKSTQSASRSQRFGDNAAWQASSGIWGSSVVANNYNRSRDASRSRDLDARPSGSGALTATSEAEPWGARSGPWKQVDTTSPTLSTAQSGSNSPIRHRGSIQGVSAQALGDLANASSYYTSRAVGQPSASSFGRAKNDLDQNGHKLGSNMANHLSEDKENPVQRGRLMSSAMESDSTGMRMDRSQFPGHLSVGGTPRDASVASARHSDIGLPNNSLFQQNAYPFGHTPHNSISQQRQSFSGRAPSFSQPSTQSPIEPAQHREVDLSAELSRFHFGKNEAQVYNHQPASEHSYPSPGNHHAQPGIKLNAQSPMYVGQGAAATRALGFAADGSPDFAQRYHAQSGPVSGRTSVSPPSTDPRGAGSSGAYGAASIDSEGFQRTDVHEQAPHALNQAYLERQLLAHQHNQHNQQLPPFVAPQYIYNNVVANFDVTSQHYRFPQAGVPYGYQLQMPGAFNVMPMAPKGPREEPKRAVGSALLEEYKTNTKSSRKFELKDVFGHITEFSGDTQGSRFIQQKLETANSDEKEMVFREIEKNALQLMTDVFGNYVVQKLFEHGSQVQKRMLADTMRNHVFNLSLQPYGCRVVQKALEHVLVDQQADLVKELRVDIMRCVKDQHGNHVVQKAIERVPSEHTRFIMDAFRGQVHSLATHNYGCRVVQRMLEFSPPADQAEILAELHQCAPMLIQDQFGNYVIQHIIVHGKPEDRSAIIKIVQSQIVTLSKHKFASNVVEKSIQYGTEEERKNIVTQLTTDQPNGTSPLSLLMKDQFGNYVIQKLLGQLDGEDRERVVEVIKPLLAEYKKYNYGKQIAAIEKLVFKGASSTNSRTSAPIDINSRSEAPTPILTMEQNSPQSCSPPSTNASINEANVGDVTKALPEVRIAGAED